MQDLKDIAKPQTRVALFMTALSREDIPGHDAMPACLLPLGCASFAERILASCARVGLREIDLVVSEQPEKLRHLLGDGSRWGLKLNWHLSRETSTPYSVLHSLGLLRGQRLLIGHGDRWIHEHILMALAGDDHSAVVVEPEVSWTGWMSMDAIYVNAISPHADYEALAGVAMNIHCRNNLIVESCDFAHAGSAQELLLAQNSILNTIKYGDAVPATWLRFPWGAQSPDAIIHPLARITGPVLVGPGCTVGCEAEIGPGTVLSRDVLIADGAVVRRSLVLPNTYVGGSITLEDAVAHGSAVQHLKLGVRTTMSRADAVLTSLVEMHASHASWTGRLLAGVLAIMLLPLIGVLATVQMLRAQPCTWLRMRAVTGRNMDSGELDYCEIRTHRQDKGAVWLIGQYGALLDVVQGRRQWFGVRPRNTSQWYALGRDWQTLFARVPLGLLHSPAWADADDASAGDASAVADAYFSVQSNVREYLRILRAVCWLPLRKPVHGLSRKSS